MFTREKLRMLLAEFLGTAMLASVVLVVGNMFGSGTAAWYISISAGVTLSVIVGLFGSASGAHVNPAVTVGLWTLKKIPTMNALMYVAAQLLGGLSALLFYNYLIGDALPAAVVSDFSWQIFWAEFVGSAIFGMGIAAAISQKLTGYYSAFLIGLSLSFGALVASVAAAGFLNPAVALANNALDLTYTVAPVLGMVTGMNIYMAFIAPPKETVKVIKKRR